MTASSFPDGFRYFRMVSAPVRRLFVVREPAEYEVAAAPGQRTRVTLRDLPSALGAPADSRRDWQECEMRAQQRFSAGSDDWIEYPTGIAIAAAEFDHPEGHDR